MNMNKSENATGPGGNETSDISKARLRAWLQILKV